MFGINKYALLAIVVIAVTISFIAILIVHTIKYSIKQKRLMFNECIKNEVSYKKNMEQYNEKLEEAGITSKKKRKKLIKILEVILK